MAQSALHKLSDTNLTVADPAEDIRGLKVVDRAGEDIGHVDDLLIDERDLKVRFIRVAAGGFLGLGETKFLVPVDAVTGVRDGLVTIDQSRDHVAGSPRYDPDLADQDFYGNIYGHYGYAPYWGAGYIYPGFPYFP